MRGLERSRLILIGSILTLLAFVTPDLRSQGSQRFDIDSTRISISEPFDSSSFFSPLNRLHGRTREGVVRRLVARTLLTPDSISVKNLGELERNLRDLGIFWTIEVEPETADRRRGSRLSVRLEDAWSLYPEPVRTSGDDRVGIILRERNIAGTAISLGVGSDLPSSGNDSRLFFTLADPELAVSDLQLTASAFLSGYRSDYHVRLSRPFHTDDDRFVYGLEGIVGTGKDLYFFGDPAKLGDDVIDSVEANRTRVSSWFGTADNDEDLFVGSVALHLDRYDPSTPPPEVHAFANTLGIFVGIASVGRDYREYDRFEANGSRFVPIGGMGRVSIGKYLAIDGDTTADDLIYFGAEARQSIGGESWFAHFSAEAGTGLLRKEPARTLLRAVSSTGIRLGPGTVAARGELQVVWRWPRYIYSSAQGLQRILRGYLETDVLGDNHLAGTMEYRLDPVVLIGSFGIAPTFFWDVAGFWNRDREFSSARFHNAAGAGIRLWHRDGVSRPGLRIDVAYNFDRGRIGGVSIGIAESFDLFGFLGYLPPGPYLPE